MYFGICHLRVAMQRFDYSGKFVLFGLDLTLVTNNTREFSRVPRLKLANWTEPVS
jgi:hypothetical protein